MIVKKNILYFANILIFLCFTSYIGSFIISAFFASQEIDITLKIILVALIAIIIGACYIIGSAANEWDLVQDFYDNGNHVRIGEIVAVSCMMVFSVCISIVFYRVNLQAEGIISIVFAVLVIPAVYAAGRAAQNLITGLLASIFCMVLPVGAISGSEGFIFHYGDGFLKSCSRGFQTISNGGIFVNILTRLENITNFNSSFPKLIMCIFFFFAIWSGLFLFITKKNGGFFLTIYFNLIIVLQVLFDFSDYFYLLIYPAAALAAAMGISFFVHKWIFDEDLEEGYDDATESSFEKFSIVKEEDAEEELRKTSIVKSTNPKEMQKQEERPAEEEPEITEIKRKEKVETNAKKQAEASKEIQELQEPILEEQKQPEPVQQIEVEKEEKENKGLPVDSVQEKKEELELVEEKEESELLDDFDVTGTEHVVVMREIDFTEPDMEESVPIQEERFGTLEQSDDAKADKLMEMQEKSPVWEEDETMLDDESKRLDQEEAMLFGSSVPEEEKETETLFSSAEQDEDEVAFFEELATSAKETERLREQVQQAEEELMELTEKYRRQKMQLKDLIQLLEQAKEHQKRDSEEIATSKRKIVRLESEVKGLNRDIKEKDVLVEEYREQSLKTEGIKEELEKAEEQNAILRKDVEEQKELFQKELEEQRKETEKYRRTSEEHRTDAEKYRQAAEEHRIMAEQLREEAKSARLEVETAKAENERYKEEANSFRKQSEEYRQENVILLNRIDDLKEQLEIAGQDNSKEQLERLKEEKEQLDVDYQNRFEELQAEKAILERRYQEEVQKRKELLRRAKEEINRVRNQASKKSSH